MEKSIKTGSVDVPDSEFKDENITALVSIRLPMTMLKELKRLSLTEEYSGRYQTLIKKLLSDFIKSHKPNSRKLDIEMKSKAKATTKKMVNYINNNYKPKSAKRA